MDAVPVFESSGGGGQSHSGQATDQEHNLQAHRDGRLWFYLQTETNKMVLQSNWNKQKNAVIKLKQSE